MGRSAEEEKGYPLQYAGLENSMDFSSWGCRVRRDRVSLSLSFRIDWFNLLAVQGTLKSLFQHHSAKASILQHSAFFMAQFSHPYMTIGKTIAWTLLFNMLSRFVIACLHRNKDLFISWLQSPSAMILEPKKIK